jgi:hypothetical protein
MLADQHKQMVTRATSDLLQAVLALRGELAQPTGDHVFKLGVESKKEIESLPNFTKEFVRAFHGSRPEPWFTTAHSSAHGERELSRGGRGRALT